MPWAGKMVHQLRAWMNCSPRGHGFISSSHVWHTSVCDSASRASDAVLWPHGYQAYTFLYADRTPIHRKKVKVTYL